ncbi:uncharacterized protein LOC124806820 isoform X1 [Hydra vulgaris]|uniref:uncharacterized protein LOC124806820 isoform X1 n=1 Tax=Hydra vulgaris TaxID=6087 RepID=UPI001F5EF5B8|nr:uncharacterized protein LOC124806820 [Hydra vulgaris]
MTNATFATEIIKDNKYNYCQLTTVKRLLGSLGINAEHHEGCILKQSKDVRSLISSYLESILEKPVKKELEIKVKAELSNKKINYCCSPRCDKFMKRMNYPNIFLVICS